MKKYFYSFFAAVAMMLAVTSCSQEDVVSNETSSAEEVEVSFNIAMEGQNESRAIGDGKTVNELFVAVYDVSGKEIEALRQDAAHNNSVTVNNLGAVAKVRLVKGQTYQFVFWAQNNLGGALYYDTSDMKAIKVKNYTDKANDETRDAFYAYVKPITVTSSFSQGVTLKRPFAQLNLGTTAQDIAWAKAAGIEIKKTKVSIVGPVYTTLSTFDGNVSGDANVNLALGEIPNAKIEDLVIKDKLDQFKIDNYEYLASEYLLVGNESAMTTTITYELTDASDKVINKLTIENAPLQRNWRTNIVGEILTGEGTFNIEIDPIFDADRNYPMDGSKLDIWDGTYKAPTQNANGEYEIDAASKLAYIWNDPSKNWDGATFVLTKDLSFKNVEASSRSDKKGDTTPVEIQPLFTVGNGPINVTFQGNNHVIRDFVVKGNTNVSSLFGVLRSSTIKNLTIINAEVNGNEKNHNAWSSIVIAHAYSNITLENVIVKDSKLTGGQKVGGLIGFGADGLNLNITNCTVDGLILDNYDVMSLDPENEGSGSTGGLIGFISVGNNKIINCYVKNSVINTIQGIDNAKRANGEFIGVINNGTIEITNCGVENNHYRNSREWTPYHNPFVGGNRGNATLIVNGNTYDPVPTYTGEVKLSDPSSSIKTGIITEDIEGIYVQDATFETLVLDKTYTSVVFENLIITKSVKIENNNTVLLKNVSFENEGCIEITGNAQWNNCLFILYPGTVKVKGTLITSAKQFIDLMGLNKSQSVFYMSF